MRRRERSSPFASGVVLAAGGSRRLGQPKQLLPYRGVTLLDHVVATARHCSFDQLLVALGGAEENVRAQVDLVGAEVVVARDYRGGCSSSIAAAIERLDPRCEVLVLMLGDQPGVTAAAVRALLAGRGDAPMAVSRYDDGRGHPLAFGPALFDDLSRLHGDKGVWRLMDQLGEAVVEVPVPGPVPLDVDTWADYESVLAGAGTGAGRHDWPRAHSALASARGAPAS